MTRRQGDSGRGQRSPTFPIVYEDADLLVVNKPAGLLTSTVPREPRKTLLAMVREYVHSREPRARVGLIHRLDKDASGLLVFSKNDPAYRSLKDQFFKHTVERIYLAVVEGALTPASGRIRTRLIELVDGSVRSTKAEGKGELAITEFQTLRGDERLSLMRVKLHTGRKHQIRAHLSERGATIVGDRMYGKSKPAGERLMLAAVELSLDHPRTARREHFEIPLPAEMSKLCRKIGE